MRRIPLLARRKEARGVENKGQLRCNVNGCRQQPRPSFGYRLVVLQDVCRIRVEGAACRCIRSSASDHKQKQ